MCEKDAIYIFISILNSFLFYFTSPLHFFTLCTLLPSLPPPAVFLSLSFTLSLFHSLPVSFSLPCAAALHQPVSKSVVRGIESEKLYVADVQLNADLHYCMHPLTSPPPATGQSGSCVQGFACKKPQFESNFKQRDSFFSPNPQWTSGCTLLHFRITPFQLTSPHCKRSEGKMEFWGTGRRCEQRKNILCLWNAALVFSCWAQTACWMVGGTTQSEGSDWLLCQLGDGLEGHLMVTGQSGKDSSFQELPVSPRSKWQIKKISQWY